MSHQLTCIACQMPIYIGQRAVSIEFGMVEQSERSGRAIIKGYALDQVHIGCIHTYMSRINNETYDQIREFDRKEIRKTVIAELKEEIKQEVYDEIDDELKRTCAVCQAELEEEEAEDDDPIVKSAIVQGPEFPPLPPSPFGFPPSR